MLDGKGVVFVECGGISTQNYIKTDEMVFQFMLCMSVQSRSHLISLSYSLFNKLSLVFFSKLNWRTKT